MTKENLVFLQYLFNNRTMNLIAVNKVIAVNKARP